MHKEFYCGGLLRKDHTVDQEDGWIPLKWIWELKLSGWEADGILSIVPSVGLSYCRCWTFGFALFM